MRSGIVLLLLIGCATPASVAEKEAAEARTRELATCSAEMAKIVNPYAGQAYQACFERWTAETCEAKAELLYWEVARAGARGRLLKTSREALARMPEKQQRVDDTYKLCLAYAERGTR